MTEYKEINFPELFIKFKEARELDRDLLKELSFQEQQLRFILDRGISVDDNWDARRITVTSHATPGTEFSSAHELGKVPTGYIVYRQDGAGAIYDGTTANTATTVYFRSDAGSTEFRVILF